MDDEFPRVAVMTRSRAVTIVLVSVIILSMAVIAQALLQSWHISRVNTAMAALASGQDIAVSPKAPPPLQAARAAFLLAHGRAEDAQFIADRMEAANDPQSHADLLYTLGNFMLRRGLAMYFTRPMRETAPVLRIAQAEYRAALQDDPGNWDARYNLDIVDALVRDDGAEAATTGARMAPDKATIPDEPGAPSGLP